jgi:SAM-dependent methyltransferase
VEYSLKVRATKNAVVARASRKIRHAMLRRRGEPVSADDLLREYAPGRAMVDVGGMWGNDGAHGFRALELGATTATCIDLYRTAEFDRRLDDAGGNMRFVYGDASATSTADAVGEVDLVWCFGLFYHHPSPFEILQNLRRMCRERLLIETLGIPEVPGVKNLALWIPHLPEEQQRLWAARVGGGVAKRRGITAPFDPSRGYGNNFWAPSPSAMCALLHTAGFAVEWHRPWHNTFRYVFAATPIPTEGGLA